ncbi:glycosyltransferase [Vibrio furnissii]|uniref:glycosyltransferase n=1 Tax=Vibrio furnissii TaxID=29494 RepID=UPI001302E39A|nr:glycosyltransferase [Vibrio furnissii]
MIGVVILNYKTYNDTYELIESIHKLSVPEDLKIIVVDNCSVEEKLCELKNKVKRFNYDVLYLSEMENLGFARGMNIGISMALKLGCNYVVCSNNDIILPSSFSFSGLISKYEIKNDTALIGPRILTLSNEEQNPLYVSNPFKSKLKSSLTKIIVYLPFIGRYFYIARGILKEYLLADKFRQKNGRVQSYEDIYCMHGAFFVLTPSYFKYYNGLDKNTFLYFEELILASRIKLINCKSEFNNDYYVIHKEDSSTNEALGGEGFKKRLFVLKENYKSLCYFVKNYLN